MHFDFSSIESTVSYIQSFGAFGPIIAFVLLFIQAIAPVVPYMIFAGAVGMIYGNWVGFWLAWIAPLAGACFLFLISKRLANWKVIRKMMAKYNFNLQNVDEKYVFWVLLISRIFPIVPTPIINIGSGLGNVSWKVFTLSSGIGKIPWAIVYVALGSYFIHSKNWINTLAIIGAIFLISVVGIYCLRRKMPNLATRNKADEQ